MAGNVLERLALLLESGAAPAAEGEAATANAVDAFEQKLKEIEEAVKQGGDVHGALARYLASAFSALPAPSVWQAAMLSQSAEALAGRSPLHKGGAAEAAAAGRIPGNRLGESTFITDSSPRNPGEGSTPPGERRVFRDAGRFTLPPRPGTEANEARRLTAAAPLGSSAGIPNSFSLPGAQSLVREADQGREAGGPVGRGRVPESVPASVPERFGQESVREEPVGQDRGILADLARACLEIAAAFIRVPAREAAATGGAREEGTLAAWLAGHAARVMPEADEAPRVAPAGIFSVPGKDGPAAESHAPSGSADSGGSVNSTGWAGSGVAAAFLLSGQLPPEIAANLAIAQKVVELTRTPLAASFVKSVAGSRAEHKSITTTVSEVVVKTPGAGSGDLSGKGMADEAGSGDLFTRSMADEIESLVAEFDDGIWA